MNNADSSVVIPANKAQDLLNVDVTPGGRSVKKRRGYGLSATLAITTSPVHGIYSFYDSNGNTVDLYFNDTRLESSVNGGSPTVLFSTGTNGATYQCVDSQGYAYCANTGRTPIIKTDGATATPITGNANGTLIAVTQERLASAGFSAAPNRIDLSKASDFTTWTVGAQDTDPVQFTVVSPGSRITHIVYAFGRIIWFKDTSFGYILEGETQADWQVRIISPNLGTLDNTSVFREGILYFRGNDGHIYGYDGSNYTKLTRDLQGTISTSQSRTSNSWTQTAQADWEAGAFFPSSSNFTVNGDLSPKGWSQIVTSAADFGGGTFDNTVYVDTETTPGQLQTSYPDGFSTFRQGSGTKNVWSAVTCDPGITSSIGASGGVLQLYGSETGSGSLACWFRSNSLSHDLNTGATFYFSVSTFTASNSNVSYDFVLSTATSLPSPANVVFGNNIFFSFKCTSGGFLTLSQFAGLKAGVSNFSYAPSSSHSLPATVRLIVTSTKWEVWMNGVFTSSGTHTMTLSPYYFYWAINPTQNTFGTIGAQIDDFAIAPQTFTYSSPAFDTGISSPTWGSFLLHEGGNGALSFTSQVSADNSSFDSGVAATSATALSSAQKRYVKLNAAFTYTTSGAVGAPTFLSDFTLTATSTGTFYSAVKNASALTSWDSFTATKQDNGGLHTFYIRSSTNSFSATSSTPSWSAISVGAVPSISTGTYFQIRDDMVAGSTSSLASLSDFTQNWFEGFATDKSYATYFKDALWWSVVAGTGATTNNRVLRYDFLNGDWYLYDIATNGMLVRDNALYFGSTSGGYIYKFGDVDNDNGAAINAYWRSKDFFGDSPFVDKELTNLSVAGLSVANSTVAITYTLNGETSTSFTMSLYDPNKAIVRLNKNLPLGKIGNTFRVQFGNNAADQPFEIYAVQYGLREKPWVPSQ